MLITYTLNFMDKNALSNSANYDLREDNVSHKPKRTSLASCRKLMSLIASGRQSVQLGEWICVLSKYVLLAD